MIMTISHTQTEVRQAVFIRLSPGTDLVTGIADVCRRRGIRAGCIASCIASLRRASFFVVVPMDNATGGGYSDPNHLTEPVEIVSALSDSQGHVHGGHLIPGTCPILITSEILILPLAGIRLVRAFDADAGMPVLKPTTMD
jgi:predicted DNA-binding protein with PD1-like motif